MRLVTAAMFTLRLFIAGNAAAQQAPPGRTEVTAAGGPIVITPFMHASVQIEHAGRVVQVGPSIGDVSKAKAADLILVTDIHDDHMNPGRLAKLRKAGAPVVAPGAVRDAGTSIAAPIEVLANGETRVVAGIAVEAVPMYNVKNKFGDEPPSRSFTRPTRRSRSRSAIAR